MIPLVGNDVLFDGIVGSLLGSGVTLVVVVATIRHENTARRTDTLDTAVGAAYAAAMTHGMASQIDGPTGKRAIETAEPMMQAAALCMGRATAFEPELAELLQTAANDVSHTMSAYTSTRAGRDEYVKSVLRLQTTLGRWFSDADLIRHRRLTYDHVRQLADGVAASELGVKRPSRWDRLKRSLRPRR